MDSTYKSKESLLDLKEFMTDSYNLEEFEQFLVERGEKNQLEFIWAVQGLKSESLHAVGQIIRTIYKHYFEEISVSDIVKSEVRNQIKNRDYSLEIFDKAVQEVWGFLESVVYVDFINHVQNAEEATTDSNCGSSSSNLPPSVFNVAKDIHQENAAAVDGSMGGVLEVAENIVDGAGRPFKEKNEMPLSSASLPPVLMSSSSSCVSSSVPKAKPSASLEPLIEGEELQHNLMQRSLSPNSNTEVIGLTRKALKATQKFRTATDIVPVSLCKQKPKFPYHYTNSSYNPVSRQDSEVQSFSSGCLTDSDSVIEQRSKRRNRKDEVNCDNLRSVQPIPHARVLSKGEVKMDPRTFASVLTKKLQDLKRQRELDEKVTKRLNEDCITPNDLAQALRDKFHLEEQPDDILDNHVSRVWSDITPDSRSPPGRFRRKGVQPNPCIPRPRTHAKDPEPLPKSRSFPSASKYDQDSGISMTTTSTNDDMVTSWLNKSASKSNPIKAKKKEFSSVVCSYLDAKYPFCFKIPMSNVSLGVFKEYLPKKGNYRYFFKCNGAYGVVKEEIMEDDAILPVFEGKIIAELRDV